MQRLYCFFTCCQNQETLWKKFMYTCIRCSFVFLICFRHARPAIATIVALLVALALHIGKASSEMLNYSRIKRADLSILLSVLVFLILSVVLFFFFHEYFVAFFYRLFLLAEEANVQHLKDYPGIQLHLTL